MYSSSSQGGGVGVRVSTQARPTMPCISLVVLITHLLVMSSIVVNTGIPRYWEGVVTRYLY